MRVYRLSKGAFRNDISGKGAELYGGRWNSKGVPLLYTSDTQALCLVELAVHLPYGILPRDYWLITLEVPDTVSIAEIALADLPADWRAVPHGDRTQKLGDAFVANGESLILKVPSAVVPGESNYLVNPRHREIERIKIVATEAFVFDGRLFGQSI